MSTLAQLKEAQKDAMRAKDKARLGTLRLALAAIKQIEVDTRQELSESDVIAVLTKMVKQRKDSISQYEAAGRQELADIEAAEIEVINDFLPQPLSQDELNTLIDAAISQSGASGMGDMGKVMGILKPQVQGRADMGALSGVIRSRLS
ncbi:GatB/YqeY domain-containing protein [Paraferrimonas sedimenticola]|uniref:Aspartyl-tRNA amidotransferase subunit B n=1 Tax=Paraferrimonas sedimenticola TaxID=375674 RepID=A0AA37RWW9_9GAMM|nr:GatB/YqeY domain-containing protein [Paraferrimonas sedimenticola]GLP97250.1 aspartyl-tRNA amidotransferase subunit B [Paraferrimonas sedimenticola]